MQSLLAVAIWGTGELFGRSLKRCMCWMRVSSYIKKKITLGVDWYLMFLVSLSLFFFFFFFAFRAALAAHGSSQARGQIRATAACLQHSNSNAGFGLHLQLVLQLDPQRTEQSQGSNTHPHGCQSGSVLLRHNGNSIFYGFYSQLLPAAGQSSLRIISSFPVLSQVTLKSPFS